MDFLQHTDWRGQKWISNILFRGRVRRNTFRSKKHWLRIGLLAWSKPMIAEHLKTFQELLIAVRGGFIFEPQIGVHEQVAEFDFVSLYPNIMLKKNLSAETIRCSCCLNSRTRVPELDYNICEKRIGIVPTSLDIVLKKRAKYKELLSKYRSTRAAAYTVESKEKRIYDARQSSLKWILVTSFGYLGFNNAKFGRIDAHIAVCAFDRQILLKAAKIAERSGFKIVHGIVDSIWVKRKRKEERWSNNNTYHDCLELKESIEKVTGFDLSFEGIYKWIAFVHSKQNNILPVPNRYFGVYEDGSLKIRGIEARRHDTPIFFYKFQHEILEIMSKGNNIMEVKSLMPKVKSIFEKYSQQIKRMKVPLDELVFTKRISKISTEYGNRNTLENNAIMQLGIEGKSLRAGEVLQYVVTDYYGKKSIQKRVVPFEFIERNVRNPTYDKKRYVELLAETCNSITEPFGSVI